jgi:aminoglycoside phosphotransferase (APT) family kinase protein
MSVRPPLAPQRRDLDDARSVLTKWLSAKMPMATHLRLSDVRLPGGGGVANETLLFDATWTEDREARTEGFVCRVESSTFLFMESNFDLHPKIMEAVAREGVPVPAVVGYEPDTAFLGARFFVMKKVDGQVPADQPPYNESGWLVEASSDQRRALWRSGVETLAWLHAVPLARVEFLAQPDRGATGLEQYLRYNLESFEWAAQGRRHPVLEAARDWLVANVPDELPTSLAWGDARIGNMIFSDWKCAAVLDWDMVSLAGAESDLAWWILFDHAASVGYGLKTLSGLGSAEESVALWEELTGRKAGNLDYHLVFAAFRMALALMRVAQILGKSAKLPPEVAEAMETNNQGIQYVASMLGLEEDTHATVSWPGLRRAP